MELKLRKGTFLYKNISSINNEAPTHGNSTSLPGEPDDEAEVGSFFVSNSNTAQESSGVLIIGEGKSILELKDRGFTVDVLVCKDEDWTQKSTISAVAWLTNEQQLTELQNCCKTLQVTIEEGSFYYLTPPYTLQTSGEGYNTSLVSTLPSDLRREQHTMLNLSPSDEENVVVGIVDFGCDYTHSHFTYVKEKLDTKGEKVVEKMTRVVHLAWQTQDENSQKIEEISLSDDSIQDFLNSLEKRKACSYKVDKKAHGTHVMDIAAGNNGVARKAKIIFYHLLNLVPKGRKRGFATKGAHLGLAVNYIIQKAKDLKLPCVINLSIGDNSGPHDGTSAIEQALDTFSKNHNVPIVVSAGNYEKSIHYDGQLNETMSSGQILLKIPQPHETTKKKESFYQCPAFGVDVWYEKDLEVNIKITCDGKEIITCDYGKKATTELVEIEYATQYSHVGNIFVWVNGPKLGFGPNKREVTWALELTATKVPEQNSKAFHLWIERYNHPTFQVHFDVPDKTKTKSFTLNSLACGKETIVVGSVHNGSIADHCCLGPKRYPPNDIYRPQLFAPGTCIQAANSNTDVGIISMDGTSQATAFVTGIIGVMLSIAHSYGLLWPEIKDLLIPYYHDGKNNTPKWINADELFTKVHERGKEFQEVKQFLVSSKIPVPVDITYEKAKQLRDNAQSL